MAKKAELPKVPEARQCNDPESHLFGSIAVKSGIPGIAWSVMTPNNGGHHDPDGTEVKDWPTLPAPEVLSVSEPVEPPVAPPVG